MVAEGGRQLLSRESAASDAPLFTIVTALFNGVATIEKAIQSVVGQSFKNFQYVVVDAGSIDGTIRILERWNDRIDYWRSEPDAGIYDAWNKGIKWARGRWIAFLGADDEYYPDALERYAQFLSSHDDGALQYVSSRVDFMRDGRRLATIGKPWSWPAFSRYMTVAHVGSLHHRSLFDQFGAFDPSYRICGDYELLLRPRAALRAAFLPATTARMAYGGVSNVSPRPALLEAERAKRTSGGRAAWLCAAEFHCAQAKTMLRSLTRR
jgi:glycosyltransferase involved in cell wall biosynthesis